jgi:transcriptional regulator with GAF, ATPase, and Fis domain
MNKTQPSFETFPSEASPTVLSRSLGVRRDIQLHINAVYELVNMLLDQVEILDPDSEYSNDVQCLSLPEQVRRFEIELIQRALARTGGSQVQAARTLGVNPTTLNAKIKRYRLQWPYLIDSRTSQLHQPSRDGA